MQEKICSTYACRGGGCSGLQYQMGLEEEQNPNDKVFTSNGVRVFIDMKSALYSPGRKSTIIDGLIQSGFKLPIQRQDNLVAAANRSTNLACHAVF